MNDLSLMMTVAFQGLATATLSMLVIRCWGSWRRDDRLCGLVLPWHMRASKFVAVVLEPVVTCLLPGARRRRLSRTLERLGMATDMSPGLWDSICLGQGLIAATIAWLASGGTIWVVVPIGVGVYLHGNRWLGLRCRAQQRLIDRELPAWLDLMTVCVEAGATLTSGLRLIVAQSPESPLREYFERVLREVRGGRPRALAFLHVAEIYGVESLSTLATALSHAEGSGMSLGQVLRAQAEQRTAERFARAEKLAMEAPIKMLGPLIFCVFPCTFIVIGVPIFVRLKEALLA